MLLARLEMNVNSSGWWNVGMTSNAVALSFNNRLGDCVGSCANWSIGQWSADWTYGPDFYSTHEAPFVPGANLDIDHDNNPALTSTV